MTHSAIATMHLFHTMACFYVIYWYVFTKWRSIRPVEINQLDITMDTHYDITMGNDVAMDAHCDITMGINFSRDIHCDVTMSNNIDMNIFYYTYILCSMPNCVILLWVVWNKNKNMFMFDQSELENTFVVFV